MTNKIKDDPRIDKRLKAVFGDIPVDSVMDSVAQTRDEILELSLIHISEPTRPY